MKNRSDCLLWLAVGLAFTLLLAVWMTFFVLAARNPVEQVPVVRATP